MPKESVQAHDMIAADKFPHLGWIHHLLDVRAVQYPEVNCTGTSQVGQTIRLSVYVTFKDNNTGQLDSAVWTCYWSKFEPNKDVDWEISPERGYSMAMFRCSVLWFFLYLDTKKQTE